MIFAISDLHLPGGDTKPMDVFGAHWANHFERICEDWRARVRDDDLVLLPGDTSWAMHISGAMDDLAAIGSLPGTKVLLRGNHDYWWSSISKVREVLPEGMYALQNDALWLNGAIICGSRGWTLPGAASFDEKEDMRIYQRELGRLELSLKAAEKTLEEARQNGEAPRLIAMLHYPPVSEKQTPTEVTALLAQYGVETAVYGHLHGPGLAGAFEGMLDGVHYHQASCDGLGFKLLEI